MTDNGDRWQTTSDGAHRDIDRICHAWTQALDDLYSIGYRSNTRQDNPTHTTSELTPTEAAAEQLLTRGSPAAAYIAELADLIPDLLHNTRHPGGQPWTPDNSQPALHQAVNDLLDEIPASGHWPQGPAELVQRITRTANYAASHWPNTPKKGETVEGVTVGQRGNTTELCALCGIPAVSGRDANGKPLIRRLGDGRTLHTDCHLTLTATPITRVRPQCEIDDCDKPVHARRMCQGHYNRWRQTGVIGGHVGVA